MSTKVQGPVGLWESLENSPLSRALSDPLPFELGRDDGDDEPGLWHAGLEWLDQLHQARAIQRHLSKFSAQGDMLFPEEYIVHMLEKEEREWREWDAQTRSQQQHYSSTSSSHLGTSAASVAGVGGMAGDLMGDDDDDDDDDDDYIAPDPHYYQQQHSRDVRQRRSYAAAVASTAANANQAVLYDESGRAFEMGVDSAFYVDDSGLMATSTSTSSAAPNMMLGGSSGGDGAYLPTASQFDPRTGLMTTPAASSAVPPSSPSAGAGAPSPSSSPNLSAFQSYEGFGGMHTSAHRF